VSGDDAAAEQPRERPVDLDAMAIADEVVECLERAMYVEHTQTMKVPRRLLVVEAPDCGCEYLIDVVVTNRRRTH
jgi:hypothetical protein